jgi:hypothetical protein
LRHGSGSGAAVATVRVAILALGGFLGGCTGRAPETILASNDTFRPYRELESGVLRLSVTPGHMLIRLIAQIDRKTGTGTILVKVQHSYLGQHRNTYETARNAKAEPLKLTVVARYGNCHVRTDCPIDELYMIEIPEAELRAAGPLGYHYKVFPRVGRDILVAVPADMIKGLLTMLDADRRAKPTAQVATKSH